MNTFSKIYYTYSWLFFNYTYHFFFQKYKEGRFIINTSSFSSFLFHHWMQKCSKWVHLVLCFVVSSNTLCKNKECSLVKRGPLCGSVVKNLPGTSQLTQWWKICLPMQNSRDTGSGPGSGRSPGGGNGKQLLCACLKNPMDRGQDMVHGVTESWTWLSVEHIIDWQRVNFCCVAGWFSPTFICILLNVLFMLLTFC